MRSTNRRVNRRPSRKGSVFKRDFPPVAVQADVDSIASVSGTSSTVKQSPGTGYERGTEDLQQLQQNVNGDVTPQNSRSSHRQDQNLKHEYSSSQNRPYRGKWRRGRHMRRGRQSRAYNKAPRPCTSVAVDNADEAFVMLTESSHKEEEEKQEQNDRNTLETLADGTVHEHRVITSLPHKGHNLKFQVQLAHGSPTGIIYGFTNIMQLYELIADCYDEITVDDILFCTVNTHRVCMDALMSSNISNDDLIFAHIAGQKKEVTLVKTNPALGLTIADNGIGKAFIKRIVPGTVTSDANPALQVGDFIEKVNDDSMVGRRHFDVARYLRSLPVGSTFTMRVVEPKRTGFSFLTSYRRRNPFPTFTKRKDTIRFKSDGTVLVQEGSINEEIINEVNNIIDSYFGFHDDDFANTIWELVASSTNFTHFKSVLQKSDVNDFNFPEEFFFDIWRIRSDWKNSRLTQRQANVSTADETLAPDKATDLHAGTSE